MIAGRAAGEESLSDMRARMATIQAKLDAATAKIEELRTDQEHITEEIRDAEDRIHKLEARDANLEDEVVRRARLLYRSGGTQMVELLFDSEDLSELTERAELLSHASLEDASVFVELARSKAEQQRLTEELQDDRSALAASTDDLRDEVQALQAAFNEYAGEYQDLKDQLAAELAAAAPPSTAPAIKISGAMACPVAGPVSFSDTWGAPRSGHTHQGVDMMAASGTPIVAIVDGTITYSGYGSSAGNWLILSGDDGNGYWYMHNQENLVTGGHVSVGQQIATVGDTGNAAGTPHLHFEFHPGGGAAVNPTPLVASIC
jgi:murein DD-endopeptidase MepM/ murein hydrolase activator NlpD